MASSNDFTANQIRAAKLILTGTQPGDGGVGVRNIGLAVYDESLATNQTGGISDSNIFDSAGTDVAIFVSGSQKSRGTNATSGDGVFLLGGDTYISGTLVVENAGRTHGSISGSIQRMADGRSYLVAGSNITISSASDGQVTITGGAGADGMGSGFTVNASTNTTPSTITAGDTLLLAAGAGITTTATSDGTVTIASTVTDTNTFRTVAVDTSGDGSADATLGASETLMLKKGTNITLSELGGVVTISSADTDTNTQNTTTLSFVDSSNDIILRNTTGGATSSTDDIKFVAGSNITLTHTDADNITIAATGGGSTILQTSVYSNEGGFQWVPPPNIHHMCDRLANIGTGHMVPPDNSANRGLSAYLRLDDNEEKMPGMIVRTLVPTGAANVKLTVCFATSGSGTNKHASFLVTGRKMEEDSSIAAATNSNADTNAASKPNTWMNVGDADFNSTNGGRWRGFTSATGTSNKIAVAREGDKLYISESRSLALSGLINDGSSTIAAGDVLDIAIARNKTSTVAEQTTVATEDNLTDELHLFWIKVQFIA